MTEWILTLLAVKDITVISSPSLASSVKLTAESAPNPKDAKAKSMLITPTVELLEILVITSKIGAYSPSLIAVTSSLLVMKSKNPSVEEFSSPGTYVLLENLAIIDWTPALISSIALGNFSIIQLIVLVSTFAFKTELVSFSFPVGNSFNVI